MIDNEPFVFCTERRLVRLTGRKARDLVELLAHLGEVSGASIFFHTHHAYLSRHFERAVFHNDFAVFAETVLQEPALAEKLAEVSILGVVTLRDFRERTMETIRRHLAASWGAPRAAPPGREFHFCESQSFIFPTGLVARDVPEFFAMVPALSNVSLFFHFFEARLRVGRPTNDFSVWLEDRGEKGLARKMDRMDPYRLTLEELKSRIANLGRGYRRTGHGNRSW